MCQEPVDGGTARAIAYASRALKKSEINYPAHKLEFLGLKWAVTKKFHDYLYGQKFTVTTDNNPLTYVLTTAKLDATGHRWLADISTYDFDIKYKPGVNNTDADALSRLPRREAHLTAESVSALCQGLTATTSLVEVLSMSQQALDSFSLMDSFPRDDRINWTKEQLEDKVIAEVYAAVKSKERPTEKPDSVHLAILYREWDSLVLSEDILYRRREVNGEMRHQLVLPEKRRRQVFAMMHDDLGHFGREKTLSVIRERFFWPKMLPDVEEWIRTCERCLRRKAPHLPERAPLTSITSYQPMELVCMDYLSLEESKGGYSSVLVVTDHFTKYALAFPTRNQTAITTARILFDNFIVPYGVPMKLHSDQGRNFESQVISELCKICGVQKTRTTPYHAMGNGITERINRTLLSMLGTLCDDKKRDWKSHLATLMHAYNSTKHESTGFSPHFLMFGRQPRLPADVILGLKHPEEEENIDQTEYAAKLRKRLEYVYRLVSVNNRSASSRQKKQYDVKVRGGVIQVGDRVLLRKLGVKGKHKLGDKWEQEVYIVLEQPNQDIPVYSIQREDKKGRVRVIHRNLLFPLSLPLSHKVQRADSKKDLDTPPAQVTDPSQEDEDRSAADALASDVIRDVPSYEDDVPDSDEDGDEEDQRYVRPVTRGMRTRRLPVVQPVGKVVQVDPHDSAEETEEEDRQEDIQEDEAATRDDVPTQDADDEEASSPSEDESSASSDHVDTISDGDAGNPVPGRLGPVADHVEPVATRRGTRNRAPPKWFKDYQSQQQRSTCHVCHTKLSISDLCYRLLAVQEQMLQILLQQSQ